MVIFKSASQIQQFLASNASDLDIIGYNLEPGQTHDANELANPVAAAQNCASHRTAIWQTGSYRPHTHDLTLCSTAQRWPPLPTFGCLQIQKAQNDPQLWPGEFV
jgi:hypothetical protein